MLGWLYAYVLKRSLLTSWDVVMLYAPFVNALMVQRFCSAIKVLFSFGPTAMNKWIDFWNFCSFRQFPQAVLTMLNGSNLHLAADTNRGFWFLGKRWHRWCDKKQRIHFPCALCPFCASMISLCRRPWRWEALARLGLKSCLMLICNDFSLSYISQMPHVPIHCDKYLIWFLAIFKWRMTFRFIIAYLSI